MVAARIVRADQAAFGPAEALRLQNAGELANEVASGLGERCINSGESRSFRASPGLPDARQGFCGRRSASQSDDTQGSS